MFVLTDLNSMDRLLPHQTVLKLHTYVWCNCHCVTEAFAMLVGIYVHLVWFGLKLSLWNPGKGRLLKCMLETTSLIPIKTCNNAVNWITLTYLPVVFTYSLLVHKLCMSFRRQRSILNFTPRDKLWPPGVKLSPGGEILCSPLHSSKQYRVFTPGGERRGELHP
jgi:hypothetical protein